MHMMRCILAWSDAVPVSTKVYGPETKILEDGTKDDMRGFAEKGIENAHLSFVAPYTIFVWVTIKSDQSDYIGCDAHDAMPMI